MSYLQDVLDKINETTDFEHLDSLDVNTKGLFENTPLHVVVTWNDIEAAKELISAGADINAIGEYGFTPLHRAISKKSIEFVKLFINSGADKSIKNVDGDDAISLAKKLGAVDIIKFLTA